MTRKRQLQDDIERSMLIRQAKCSDKEQWDAYAGRHPNATPYHLSAWSRAVGVAYGHENVSLLAEEAGNIIGLLPLVLMRLPLVSKQLVSLPFCDVGGALADTEEIAAGLYAEALAFARRLGAKSLDFRCRGGAAVPAGLGPRATTRTDKVSMLLDLPGSSETLWEGFRSKLRSQVRKAEKNGLGFSWGGRADRADFYEVFARNMWELGSPVHSRKWVEAVLDGYGDAARLGLVRKGDIPVGGGIILALGDTVCIPWASTVRAYNNLSPNMLLYWNVLKHAADSGAKRFDFGRSTPGEGTFRFKEQWGAAPCQLYWYSVGPEERARERADEAKKQTPASGNREHLAMLWARLPFSLANLCGPLIRGYISL